MVFPHVEVYNDDTQNDATQRSFQNVIALVSRESDIKLNFMRFNESKRRSVHLFMDVAASATNVTHDMLQLGSSCRIPIVVANTDYRRSKEALQRYPRLDAVQVSYFCPTA